MRLWLSLFLLVSLHAAQAQEPAPPASAPPLVQAPSEPEPPPLLMDFSPHYTLVLERGVRVRVETGPGERQSGELMSLTPGALSLQSSPEQVLNFLLTDVQRLETRKRAPGYGALIGGGTGTVLGSLSFALLCLAIADGGNSGAGGCAVVGGLVVGALGAGVGALLGLAVPRWSTVYEKAEQGPLALRLTEPPDDEEISHWFSGRGPVGEVGIQLGYGRDLGISQPTEGWGGRFHLLALVGPYFAIGPEVAWYSHIGTATVGQPSGQVLLMKHHLTQVLGLARAGVEIGPTRTAVLVGMGLQDARSDHLGASVGGEVELDLGQRVPPVAVEVRYHFPLSRNDFEPVEQFLTFGLGSRLRW